MMQLIQKMNGDHYMSVILQVTEPTDVDIHVEASHQNKSYIVTNIVILSVVVQYIQSQQGN